MLFQGDAEMAFAIVRRASALSRCDMMANDTDACDRTASLDDIPVVASTAKSFMADAEIGAAIGANCD